MATFEKAIPVILRHEGGYVNNAADPGGATSYGISLRFLADHPEDGDFDHDGDVDAEDIKNMTQQEAIDIYKKYWWDAFKYDMINDQTVATKTFDLAVNMGAKRAHILLQTALNDAFSLNLTCDGIIGPATLHIINSATDDDTEQKLLTAYCNATWGFYQRLITNKPSLSVFAKGWKNRAFDLGTINSI